MLADGAPREVPPASHEPCAFISYAHEDKPLALALHEHLTERGCRAWLDEHEMRVGDSLIERIAGAIEDAQFFVVLVSAASVESPWCQRELSLAMTGEITREKSLVMPCRVGEIEMPAAVRDKLYVNLSAEGCARAADRLVTDMRRHLGQLAADAPTAQESVGAPAGGRQVAPTSPDQDIVIVGIVAERVGRPRNDGTPGDALYNVPLRLSRAPSHSWVRQFVANWDNPPSFGGMHRPGIASITSDVLNINGTTLQEVEQHHRRTLLDVVALTNAQERDRLDRARVEHDRIKAEDAKHRREAEEAARRIRFDE